jgi:hypothetical protein
VTWPQTGSAAAAGQEVSGQLVGGGVWEFFDARDSVQVKYEMVRRVSVDDAPVTATAAAFGYSGPSYYQAAAALAESGLDGLVPAKPARRPLRATTPGRPARPRDRVPAEAGRAHR